MAVTLTAATLRAALKLADDADGLATATRLLAVASEIVNRYAPSAPATIGDEAATRTAGYLRAAKPQGLALRKIETGEAGVTIELRAAGSALRLSGAMALLAPYRLRRAPGGDDD